MLATGVVVIAGGSLLYSRLRPPVMPQQAISDLEDVAMPKNGQRVLVFSPHPDDETIALAGYIAQSVRDGADVRIVLVTNGNKHHNEAARYTEFKTATAMLGVNQNNLVFLGLPDGRLHELDPNMIRQLLKEQIDSYDPEIVLYPHPMDVHPDHATTGKIVAGILEADTTKRIAYEYLVHYGVLYPEPNKLDPSLYLLPPKRLAGSDAKWERFILPQDIEDLKTLAIFSYRSQLHNPLLRELMLSSIRRNELLAIPAQ